MKTLCGESWYFVTKAMLFHTDRHSLRDLGANLVSIRNESIHAFIFHSYIRKTQELTPKPGMCILAGQLS